jgi:hypothetical protein
VNEPWAKTFLDHSRATASVSFLLELNLKPLGRSATLKESEVLVNRPGDVQRTCLVLSHAT